MPMYKYKCPVCGKVKRWKSRWKPECPKCGVLMKRVYKPAGFILKGGGFFSTENRGEKGD